MKNGEKKWLIWWFDQKWNKQHQTNGDVSTTKIGDCKKNGWFYGCFILSGRDSKSCGQYLTVKILNSSDCWVSISESRCGAPFFIGPGNWNWNPGTLEPWNPGTCSWVEKLLIKCLFINVFTVRSAAIIGAAWEVKHSPPICGWMFWGKTVFSTSQLPIGWLGNS